MVGLQIRSLQLLKGKEINNTPAIEVVGIREFTMTKKSTSGKKAISGDTRNDQGTEESTALYGQVNALASSQGLSTAAARKLAESSESSSSESKGTGHSETAEAPLVMTAASPSVNKVYQHWADGDAAFGTKAEWNNNILSEVKSDYFEGEVVPHVFYYKASNNEPLVNGQSYSFNVTYNYYQANTNAGGFLFMTSPDVDRDPANFAGKATTEDASFSNGGGMLGSFQTVNANITGVSDVAYTTRGGGTMDGHVTITFIYTGPTTQSGGAEIQYGLMIAAPGDVPDQGSGPTLGATAWTGGSLQTTVDVGGKGATSIQLMPSAIIDGEIGGIKFNDIDGNGLRDADGTDNTAGTADDEVGMAGWTIFLDQDKDGQLDAGERSTVTDASGRYSFSVTPDADPTDPDNDAYVVREVQQSGWIRTTPNPDGIVITAMHPKAMDVDFGNQQLMPSLNIVKEATVAGGTANEAGEVISYTIAVQNTGNQALTGVMVSDPMIGDLMLVANSDTADGELDVNETWTWTGTHVVTQAEIDAGAAIVNVATADSDQTGPGTDDASVRVEQAPALAIDKAIATITGGNGNTAADAAGDVLNYTITVSNPGNMTLTDVTVNDVLTGLNVAGLTLPPGQSQTYQTSYVLRQEDLNSNGGGDGYIENTATADSAQTDAVSDVEPVQVLPRASLALNKSLFAITGGNGNLVADAAGDVLNYTATVINEGNVTLTGVSVMDPTTGLNVTGVTLQPGQTAVYSTSYTLSQADIDSNGDGDGYHDNTAFADSDQTAQISEGESTPLLRTIGLGVEKNVAGITGGNGNAFADAAGDQLNYAINVYNAGTVTLTNVTVFDDLTGLNQTIASLAPGANQTYLSTYTLTQADLDTNGGGNGYIENSTMVDSDQTLPAYDNETVQLIRTPVLFLDKTFLNVTGGNGNNLVDAVGDQLNYRIVVANPSNVTLTDVSISEPLTGLAVGALTLAPGQTQTYLTQYTLTQADLDNNGGGDGYIDNIAVADSAETTQVSDIESVPLLRTIGMQFDKHIVSIDGGNGNALADAAGDMLNYSFTVTNPGSVTLTNLTVVDDTTGMSEVLASLAPGATVSYTSSYMLTQADLDSNAGGDGVLINTATADSSETPAFTDSEGVTVVYRPGIDLTKYVSVDNGLTWDDANSPTGPTLSSAAGIDPQFKYTVTNTGNITLGDVNLTDALYDLNGAEAGTAHSFGGMAVGESIDFVFTGATWSEGQNSGDAAVSVVGMPTVLDVDNAYYLGV